MIYMGYPSVSKKKVLSYGTLITKICWRVGVAFPSNASFLKLMGLIKPCHGIIVRGRLMVQFVLGRKCVAQGKMTPLVRMTLIQS